MLGRPTNQRSVSQSFFARQTLASIFFSSQNECKMTLGMALSDDSSSDDELLHSPFSSMSSSSKNKNKETAKNKEKNWEKPTRLNAAKRRPNQPSTTTRRQSSRRRCTASKEESNDEDIVACLGEFVQYSSPSCWRPIATARHQQKKQSCESLSLTPTSCCSCCSHCFSARDASTKQRKTRPTRPFCRAG